MNQKRKSKNVAVILALTTGFIGGHRFYLGQPLLAVVYIGTLLVGWKQEMVLSFYAIALGIDFLSLLFVSDDKFDETYNGKQSIVPRNNEIQNSYSPIREKAQTLSPAYLEMIREINRDLRNLWQEMSTEKDLMAQMEKSGVPMDDAKICFVFDIVKVAQVVYGKEFKANSRELMGAFLAVNNLILDIEDFTLKSDEELNNLVGEAMMERICVELNNIIAKGNPMNVNFNVGDNPKETVKSELAWPSLLELMGSKLLDKYAATLNRYALIISKADAKTSKAEEERLAEIYKWLHHPLPEKVNKSLKINEQNPNETLDEVLKELRSLIALDAVKEEVETLVNFVKIQLEREKQGLKTTPISYHIVFTGNPGTGKTTVARLIARIYKHLGVLERGHLIETDRSGLIAEYAGQTAVKTNKAIDDALDGILFIDEAYALVGEGQDSYGQEAVATLIKRMEDDRSRLVVILAGYSQEMQDFLETNPGFKSRINRYIDFADYESMAMLEIFESFCKKSQYILGDGVKEQLSTFFDNAYQNRDKTFGNGRFVRNTFEKVLENQANRVSKEKQITREMLQLITLEDL
ncbi:MAG: AAA family ATPase [Bacteroidia bacterium]|nr:AAA family ATPase [Bacteroidia bacterium]